MPKTKPTKPMAKMLMNLRHVPEDESDAVLEMLESHGIEHYRLPPSAFMISAGSIWIKQDEDFARAKSLFDELQRERAEQAQANWQTQKDEGSQPRLLDELSENPGRLLAYVTIAVLIILFMLTPVVQLFR